jgi:hypothetical protein
MKLQSIVLIFFLLCLSACASTSGTRSERDIEGADPEEQTFSEGFDSVWRAVQLAMAEYPIKVSNQDSGIIETDYIKQDQGWQKPGQSRLPPGGRRYKLNVRVFKGKDSVDTRIVIAKNADMKKNFFAETKSIPSDGLEELSIMYRVERELKIEKARKKNSEGSSDLDL